ncbi:MAG: C_GCAxxG_C_C family protein [Victivallales bacterium]|jgi:hypothetical protein|nr:C_GCAxxG_C_C family protein [Victivallales bacterium]MBT7164097.1 C_GCAxxG_C_C family protein [Victivallales bacterium]
MPVATAVDAHAKRGTNCAQAVLCGFQELLGLPDERIAAATVHGGGRAPEGTCGALHAALSLTDEPEAKLAIESRFVAQAGALSCREVLKLGKLTCRDCVRLAAELVQEQFATR